MSSSHWMQYTPVIVIAILAYALMGVALHNHYYEYDCREYCAPEIVYESNHLDRFFISSDADLEAFVAPTQEQRVEWRAEQDLHAQRNMAKWALWMVGVSTAMAAITALGVVFVAWTLSEAKRATKITRKMLTHAEGASQAELRAYLCVESVVLDKLFLGGPITISVDFKNCGVTPARKIRVESVACIGPWPWAGEDSKYEWTEPPASSGTLGPSQTLASDCTASIGYSIGLERSIEKGTHGLWVHGLAEYYDVFGERRETNFLFSYGVKAMKTGVMQAERFGNDTT